jgi:endo-1,4-beta-mannosidase
LPTGVILKIELIKAMKSTLVCMNIQKVNIQIIPVQTNAKRDHKLFLNFFFLKKKKSSITNNYNKEQRYLSFSSGENTRRFHYPVRSKLSNTSFKVRYVPSRNITT